MMKKLDDVMAELYTAKKKNVSTHKDIASYMKAIRQQERIRTEAASSKISKATKTIKTSISTDSLRAGKLA